MSSLKNLFDDFNLHARIIPALITILPIYIFLLLRNFVTNSFIQSFLPNSVIYFLLVSWFYRIVRNFGKKYEEKMYKRLGAKPTTILLRYSNNIIDAETKTRYHRKLNKNVKGIKLPIGIENENISDDEKYESAINWLRKYANSNKDKEIRVYQELKDYNFWRNLYGGKWIMIISSVLLIFIECFQLRKNSVLGLVKKPFPETTTLVVMIFILIISCTVINKKTVKNKAFDYAKTLLEVCDSL